MSSISERNADPIKAMARIANDILQFGVHGFVESYRSSKDGELIFDSAWCRISLTWGGWDQAGGNSMYIRYGRLHALDERSTMLWNGDECHCWHDIDHPLNYLDGRSPAKQSNVFFLIPLQIPFMKMNCDRNFSVTSLSGCQQCI